MSLLNLLVQSFLLTLLTIGAIGIVAILYSRVRDVYDEIKFRKLVEPLDESEDLNV